MSVAKPKTTTKPETTAKYFVVEFSFDPTCDNGMIRRTGRHFESIQTAKTALKEAYPQCDVDRFPLAWKYLRLCLTWLGCSNYDPKKQIGIVWKDEFCRDIFRRYMMGLYADRNRELNPISRNEPHDLEEDIEEAILESTRALALFAHAVIVVTEE